MKLLNYENECIMNKYLGALSIVGYDEFPEVAHTFTFRLIYMNCMIAQKDFSHYHSLWLTRSLFPCIQDKFSLFSLIKAYVLAEITMTHFQPE